MANRTVVFYGIRCTVGDDELESLEARVHPAIVNASGSELDYYWGNFDCPGERFLLFVGRQFGAFGVEGELEMSISTDDLNEICHNVDDALVRAGFEESPRFYIQFQPNV